MTQTRDLKELERKLAYLEETIIKNARDIDKYIASIQQSSFLIEDLKSSLAEERNNRYNHIIELNALKTSDADDKEHLDVLRGILDVMKNGLPDPVKAFLNPRHESEKKRSFFSGESL